MSSIERDMLIALFGPDIRETADLIGRDLAHWVS
jgi:hypothetical protein